MNLDKLIDDVNELVGEFVSNMERIDCEQAGLDRRAGYSIYISDEAIAIEKDRDRVLQYYGGFEYVDAQYRKELGDYVFYLAEDDRVQGHIEQYEESKEED